ncbi:MAG TPA: sulfite exporter TauE/SafE family protein [Candidatus Acidoferrales bacterium]|nr:sulfite exporter TauE/SafE family protein [Candidatus Acidoferrales bacterium]
MTLDPTTLLVAFSLLVAAFVKGTTGMGFPVIATPTVALLLDIRTAVTILILPNLIMDLTQIVRGRIPYEIFRRFSGMFLSTVLGVFLGTMVLVTLPLWILNLTLGVIVLAFVISNIFHPEFHIPPHQEKKLSPVMGLVGGFLNGMTNAAGPALAIYLYSLKLAKVDFIKAIATIFIVTKASQLAAVSTWNLLNASTLKLSLAVTVLVLLGFYAGLKTQDRVNQRLFNRGLLALLFVIGLVLVANALRG